MTDEMNKNNIGTITVLFYSDCPHFVQTTQDVKAILSEEGLSADIQSVDLARAPEIEQEMPFAGSPTILINGKDIAPSGDQFTGPTRGICRLYDYKGEVYDYPPKELIREALTTQSRQTMGEEKSLYERIGGMFPIALVVNRFSDEVVDNPKVGKGSLNPQLNDWSTNHLDRLPGLKYMRSLWVANVAGGPNEYTGKPLDEAHARFKIKPEEFDEVAAELRRALEYYKVPEREKEEAMAAFIAHRDEVTRGSRTP